MTSFENRNFEALQERNANLAERQEEDASRSGGELENTETSKMQGHLLRKSWDRQSSQNRRNASAEAIETFPESQQRH